MDLPAARAKAASSAAAAFSDTMRLTSRSPALPPMAIFIDLSQITCWASSPSMDISNQNLNMDFSPGGQPTTGQEEFGSTSDDRLDASRRRTPTG